MSWYRVNDFYDRSTSWPYRKVTFRKDAPFAFIKEIEIWLQESSPNRELTVYIHPSPRFIDDYNILYSTHFHTSEITVRYINDVSKFIKPIKINTDTELNQLLIFLQTTQLGISTEVIKEFQTIFVARESKETVTDRHILPLVALLPFDEKNVNVEERDLWNPEYKTSVELQNLSLKKAAKELAKGRNPNAHYNHGDLPLLTAVLSGNVKLAFLLLSYFANPYARSRTLSFESAFDVAIRQKNTDILKAITAVSGRPEKSLGDLEAKDITITSTKRLVTTQINFSTGDQIKKIKTFLKPIHVLTDIEKNELFSLFGNFFELDPSIKDRTLKEEFFKSLRGKNKYIELIYVKEDTLIGFNCFEIGFPNKHRDHIVLHCMYALILPSYRGYGLMSLLAFRLAFCLQTLLSNKKIGIFFCSVHYNSYRTTENFLHFPKYRPDHLDSLTQNILETFFKNNFTAHEDKEGISYYLDEEIRVKGKRQINSDNLLEEFFYQWLLDFKHDREGIRSAPVLFYATQHTFYQLAETLRKVNINFGKHIATLSQSIKPFFNDIIFCGKNDIPAGLPTHTIFWKNKVSSDMPCQRAYKLISRL